jgi:hypothetical protein
MKIIVGLLFLTSFAFAQGTDAALTGNVLDPSGAHVPEANVTALNTSTGVASKVLSNSAGVYLFPVLPPGPYRVTVEKLGFKRFELDQLVLHSGDHVEQNLVLAVGASAETVQVAADTDSVNYLTSTQGGTINNTRIMDLPSAGRNTMNFVTTQAGVVGTNFNGARNDMINITLDNANIQDNFITESINTTQLYVPVDRIAEVKVVTSPVDAEFGRGSGQVQLISKSGTNQYHGSALDNLHNTVLNANSWSNNRNGIARSFVVGNDVTGTLGGPIIKNKTFFFALFEASLNHGNSGVTSTTLTDPARQGIFRFYPGLVNSNASANNPVVDLSGNPVSPTGATGPLQSVSLLGRDPNRLGLDASGIVAKNLALLPSPNNWTTGDGLNTAGYVWRRASPDDIYSWTIRGDHNFNDRERFSLSYSHDTENNPNGFDAQPLPTSPAGAYTQTGTVVSADLFSTVRPTLTNDLYLGISRAGPQFHAPWTVPGATQASTLPSVSGVPYILAFPTLPTSQPAFITSPLGTTTSEDPQGRLQNSYLYGDKIHWLKGRHAIKAGVEVRWISTNSFVSFDAVPRITLGAATNAPTQNISNGSPIAGLVSSNVNTANALLTTLNGSVASENQYFFSPGGANPQWIPGENAQHTWRQREWGTFVQDDIKLASNLTLHAGLRWDYYGVPYEGDGRIGEVLGGSGNLFGISGSTLSSLFQPGVYNINNLTQVGLVGKNSPHPNIQPYKGAFKDFAPAIGMSWAVKGGDGIGRFLFGENRTVLRAGYSIAYERFTQVLFDQLWGYSAPGLLQQSTYSPPGFLNLTGAFLPLVPSGQPLTTVPINDNNSTTQTILSIDSGVKQPYVQNWNVSLGREITKGVVLDVRYVGSKGTRLLRGTNINENNIVENGILTAFQTTEAGGNSPLLNQIFNGLSIPSVGVVNGTTITGSQAMRTNSTLYAYLLNNNVGGFANFLQYNTFVTGVRGGLIKNAGLPPNFAVANPQFGSDYLIGNFSNSTYNALQIDVTKRFDHGLQFQANYVYSKALSDYDGTSQSETSSFLTLRNEHLDKRIVSFDRPNVINLTGIWEVPFGPQKRFLGFSHGLLAHVVEKWTSSVIFSKTSGSPSAFSNSGGGTFNNATPTSVALGPLPSGSPYINGNNVAYFTGLKQVTDPSVALMPANLQSQSSLLAIAGSNGNVLIDHPLPGQLGSLSPFNFRGLGSYTFNLQVSKPVVLNRERNIQMIFRADAINVLNKPIWSTPTVNIDSTSFGLITSATGNRTVNLTLRVTF